MFPGHRVALDRLFDQINLDPKIQIKYIDTKKPTCWQTNQKKFHTWWVESSLCLFNISHFSSTVCSEVMSKRTQKESGEERVTAKSRPMMSLIARAPSTMLSSASESPGKKSFGSQSPWSAKTEKDDRTRQPVVDRDASHESMHHHKQFCWKLVLRTLLRVGRWQSIGLLKSGKLINRWMIERGNPLSTSWRKDARVPITFLSWEDWARYFGRRRRISW